MYLYQNQQLFGIKPIDVTFGTESAKKSIAYNKKRVD